MLTNKMTLAALQDFCAQRLTDTFDRCLPLVPSIELREAMHYTMHLGGKRLRPMLIYAAGSIFDATADNLDIPAAAVELIHTYSLIHDDLPCMDNADLRRGKPTCHTVYGDGMAVLTGDALHTLAMQIISDHPAQLKSERRLGMVRVLSKACGPYGMAGGQALDITLLSDPHLSVDLLLDIYRLKTGALLTACLELGWLASDNDDTRHAAALREFGDNIGLAFQIQDDLLDIEASPELSGKPQGIDASHQKMTYPHLLGITAARGKVEELYETALQAIDYLGEHAHLLRELAVSMLRRNR